MTVIKWSLLSWTRRRNVRFLYLTRSAGFEGPGRTPLLKFPLSVSLRLPSPSPPSRDITSIQKYSYHEEVCCWKKWATFDQRASSQMYSSTRSYHSQTDFCIPEFHDKPLILRYSKVEEVLTVKWYKPRKNTHLFNKHNVPKNSYFMSKRIWLYVIECAGLHLVKKRCPCERNYDNHDITRLMPHPIKRMK